MFHVEHTLALEIVPSSGWVVTECSTWNILASLACHHVPRGTTRANNSGNPRDAKKSSIIRSMRQRLEPSLCLLEGIAAGSEVLGWARASPRYGYSQFRGGRERRSKG